MNLLEKNYRYETNRGMLGREKEIRYENLNNFTCKEKTRSETVRQLQRKDAP